MSFWQPKKIIEDKKREINVICPYCNNTIERTYFKIVPNINYEWDEDESNLLDGREKEVMLICCPQCRHLLGMQEW